MINLHKAEFELSFGISSQLFPSDMPEFVFVGRSNVGKSSMINKVFNRKSLARVSSMPGKTATINFFKVENARFVDLPGYGYAKVGKTEKHRWSELINGYFAQERDVALIFSLIDMRHKPSADDIKMLNFLIDNELPFVVVLTKSDKLNKTQRSERLNAFKTEIPYGDEIMMIPFSSETGEGVESITQLVNEVMDEIAEQAAQASSVEDVVDSSVDVAEDEEEA